MVQVFSPLPGIFYRRPNPNSEPYSSAGTHVAVGQTIGIIEVMKTFYEVRSEVSGVIMCFAVDDGAVVDVGDVLVEMNED